MHVDLRPPDAAARAYRLLTNIVVPRPIAWVSSRDTAGGLNLAPFSFFNLMGADPPLLAVGIGDESPGRPKHTCRNIAATGDFVVNLVTEELASAMNLTAADFPEGMSEFAAAGLHPGAGVSVTTPRVAEAQAALECTLHEIHRIGANNIILGRITAIYVADGLVDDRLHLHRFGPIGRLGSPSWYARLTDRFEIPRISYAQHRARETDEG